MIAGRVNRKITRSAPAAVALAVVFGMTPVLSAWGAQQQGEAGDEVTEVVPNSGLGFLVELSTGEIVQVFPAARNIGQEDQSRHIFLYIPPLTLKRDSAGQVETLVTTTGGVRVEMRGASPRITNGLHQWLAVDGLPAARRPGSRSVRPLPYHEIRIFDTDVVDEARWEAVYPTVADLIPVSQEWIPFVFRRRPGVSESAAEFIERLNDPVRLPGLIAVVAYGGRIEDHIIAYSIDNKWSAGVASPPSSGEEPVGPHDR